MIGAPNTRGQKCLVGIIQFEPGASVSDERFYAYGKQNMVQQMSGPDSSNGWSILHESGGWGFESPWGRDIFCLKNFDTFTRTSVHVPQINAVASAQLTFQMLTLHIYIYQKRVQTESMKYDSTECLV